MNLQKSVVVTPRLLGFAVLAGTLAVACLLWFEPSSASAHDGSTAFLTLNNQARNKGPDRDVNGRSATSALAGTHSLIDAEEASVSASSLDYFLYLPVVRRARLPLFVGLEMRWDGNGYLRGSIYENTGSHLQRSCNGMTDSDTIRCHAYEWYDPNPFGWDVSQWDAYYSISTGDFKASSAPSDPDWKWGYPWILPYVVQLGHNQIWHVDGQAFYVTGPHSGYTAFGQAVQYWELVNRDKFLLWDGGGDWTQYVHPGDITLRYDAGSTRLLLHSDIRRTFYYQGSPTIDTVQYVENLTFTNAFSASALYRDQSDEGGLTLEETIPSERVLHVKEQLVGPRRLSVDFRAFAPDARE